jgi:hypothetical protein
MADAELRVSIITAAASTTRREFVRIPQSPLIFIEKPHWLTSQLQVCWDGAFAVNDLFLDLDATKSHPQMGVGTCSRLVQGSKSSHSHKRADARWKRPKLELRGGFMCIVKLLPPSPPAEKATDSQDQAGKASTDECHRRRP